MDQEHPELEAASDHVPTVETNSATNKATDVDEALCLESKNSIPGKAKVRKTLKSAIKLLAGREKLEKIEMRYTELLEKKIARLELEEVDYNETDDDESSVDESADSINHGSGQANGKQATSNSVNTKNKGDIEESKRGCPASKKDNRNMEEQSADGAKVQSNQPETSGRVRYCNLARDKYGLLFDRTIPKPDNSDAVEKDGGDNYAISWRLPLGEESTKRGFKPVLLIESSALREALKKVGTGDPSVTLDTHIVAIPWPYEIIYHKEEKLRKLAETNETMKEDIEILLREITYELLWTLFYLGNLVIQKDIMGKKQISIIGPHRGSRGPYDSEQYSIGLFSVDYNGTDFTYLDRDVAIKSFKGAKAITDLEVIPFQKWKPEHEIEQMRQRLIERGRNFEKLCNDQSQGSFRHYTGIFMDEGADEMLPDVDGEADADNDNERRHGELDSVVFANRYPLKLFNQGKLEKGSLVIVDHEGYFDYAKKPLKLGSQTPYFGPCECSLCVELQKEVVHDLPSTKEHGGRKALEDAQCLLCPPRVFGFAIRSKVWMQLLVDNVSPVDHKSGEEPWSKLELDSKHKEVLRTLILQHSKSNGPIDDIIPGKGEGLIILLHGPPGVGKTLTAESLARLSGKPLFSISMTDVGTSPVVVERNLLRVFELATHWKALLLFDEADIFLETRSLQDLRRNSLVSVFLRLLEYFRGILFLTSNRVKTFDEAFQSRINVAVRYKELTEPQRRRIWEMWLDKASPEVEDVETFQNELGESGDLSKAELNGRQIRNVFRSAMAMAQAHPAGMKKVKYNDVLLVLNRTVDFQNYMLQNKELAEKQGIR